MPIPRFGILCIGVCLACAIPALADSPSPVVEKSQIAGAAVSGATGVAAINQTAGNGNAQANLVIVAPRASAALGQNVSQSNAQTGNARVEGFAFSGSTGILQLNQSAGAGNAQANVVVVGDGDLSAAIPQQTVAAPTSSSGSHNAAFVAKTAFAGARGLVQVSQVAGSSNRTANTFLLQVQGAAGH